MSLITRCPACGTMFNVVTDQLKVSQGWVRCGHCADVFDASLHMQATQTQLVLQPTPQQSPQVKPSLESDFTPPPPAPEPSYVSYAEEISAALKTPESSASQDALDADAHLAAPDAQGDRRAPVFAESETQDISETPDSSGDVSFVRDARRQAFWRKPIMRFLLGLLGLLLAVLLGLQLLVRQRDNVAAMEPRLKPWLHMLCERLVCDVGPPRHIEAIVIDSSSFNKINDSLYRLSFTFKNTSATPVAMPSLEVTLTDTQEQALVRRVLAPAEFGAAAALLAASSEFSGSLTLQTPGADVARAANSTSPNTAAPLRIAGYRLLAFYP